MTFALNRIGQIALAARDVDRAEAFYRDVLGLRPLYRFGRERLTGLSRGGRAGARSQDSGVSEDPGSVSIACAVGCER